MLTNFLQAQAALESGLETVDDEDPVLKYIKQQVAAKVRQPSRLMGTVNHLHTSYPGRMSHGVRPKQARY